jgi:hypothetical protein
MCEVVLLGSGAMPCYCQVSFANGVPSNQATASASCSNHLPQKCTTTPAEMRRLFWRLLLPLSTVVNR